MSPGESIVNQMAQAFEAQIALMLFEMLFSVEVLE